MLSQRVDAPQSELSALRALVAAPRATSEAGDAVVSQDHSVDRDGPWAYMPFFAVAASWAACNKEVKLRPFPIQGKDASKHQVPYTRWKVHVMSSLDAANLTCIIRDEPPIAESSPSHEVDFWQCANSAVFHEIFNAVGQIHVLADIIQRQFGQTRSAHLAWSAVKSHFIRVALNSELFLQRKLLQLEPRTGEAMACSPGSHWLGSLGAHLHRQNSVKG